MAQKSKSQKPITRRDKPGASTHPVLASQSNANEAERAVEDQFEVELCWCVQQLETCLASGKVQDKQAHELAKRINILKSGTAPLIKKRQIMRNSLGDYRARMVQDKDKYVKTVSSVKFLSNVPTKRSVFIRKAAANQPMSEGRAMAKSNNCLASLNDRSTGPREAKFTFNFQQ